jgi:hypothetical protein
LRRGLQAGNCRWEHDERHEKFVHGSLRIGAAKQDRRSASGISFSGTDGSPPQNWTRDTARIFFAANADMTLPSFCSPGKSIDAFGSIAAIEAAMRGKFR